MKFLFFSLQMPPLLKDSSEISGGASVQWKSWIRGFLDNGHTFGLLTWKGAKEYINKELEFDIVESYDPNYGINNLRIFYYQIPKLYSAIKEYKPDFVIQASATAHTGMLMIASKMLGIPFIHRVASDVHVDDRISLLTNKKEIPMYKLGLRYADYIITQNSYQLEKLKEKYPKKKIFLIHNPYEETEKIKILPRNKRTYISWIGNFRKIKNLPSLLQVATQIPHIQFRIAGAEFIEDNETSEAINKLKQLKNVEFVGYLKRSEIKPFLSKSIALLNTSFTEGFSNTFLEAWACGTPVVSTINVNPDKIISEFNLGKVANDYNELSLELKKIINCNDSQFDKLALRCYKYVRTYHNPKTLAKKFVSYLEHGKQIL